MDTSFHHAPWGTMVRRNSYYAKSAPMRLYDTARVASFEVSSEFLAAKAKAAVRQCGAKTAVETSARH